MIRAFFLGLLVVLIIGAMVADPTVTYAFPTGPR
jgi:hypothetical protein